ncbi:MAG: hypothetical protein ACLTMP_07140 [Eggerthella lenta]
MLCAPKGLSEGDLERLFAEIDAIERHAFRLSGVVLACGKLRRVLRAAG